jgi:hypothetical protein
MEEALAEMLYIVERMIMCQVLAEALQSGYYGICGLLIAFQLLTLSESPALFLTTTSIRLIFSSARAAEITVARQPPLHLSFPTLVPLPTVLLLGPQPTWHKPAPCP